MSKARGQSMKRALRRAEIGRGKNWVKVIEGNKVITKPVFKEPRIVTEFVETLGKLFILKRPTCGNNRKRNKRVKKRPYYNIVARI